MKYRKSLITAAILLLGCLAIRIYSSDSLRVEAGYTSHAFPVISRILRFLLGWLPFSFGDILYAALLLFLLIKVFRFLRFLFRKKQADFREKFIGGSIRFLNTLCVVYLVFNIFWGINYNRKGVAFQLELAIKDYSTADLKMINRLLAEKVNASKQALARSHAPYPTDRQLFSMTTAAYERVSKQYPFLTYSPQSLKKSMWGWLGNYTGFLGYYNPFTGEAHVNTTVPKFTQPFTACHETAHQLGYAKEMEANFVGYLAATASSDTLFHYSVYTDLFLYANRSLYFADTAASAQYRKLLSPSVVADLAERRKFNLAHRSFMEPIVRVIYGKYLESNQQPKGMLSYDEVTAFIIAYYKKFGKI